MPGWHLSAKPETLTRYASGSASKALCASAARKAAAMSASITRTAGSAGTSALSSSTRCTTSTVEAARPAIAPTISIQSRVTSPRSGPAPAAVGPLTAGPRRRVRR